MALPIVIAALADIVTSTIKSFLPETPKDKLRAIELAIQQQAMENEVVVKLLEADAKQIEANTEQAKSTNLFVSGARPAIMWGLGGILILYFMLATICSFGVALQYHVITMPPLDPMIRDIVLGLLGLGWLARSYEKGKGVTK